MSDSSAILCAVLRLSRVMFIDEYQEIVELCLVWLGAIQLNVGQADTVALTC